MSVEQDGPPVGPPPARGAGVPHGDVPVAGRLASGGPSVAPGPGVPPGMPGPGVPGPGTAGPGGPGKPPGKRPLPKIAIAAGAVVVLAGAVTGAVVLTGGEEKRRPKAVAPSGWAVAAGKRLLADPGLAYSGTVTANGRSLGLRLRVSREGVASGSLTAGPATALLVTAGGATYVKADQAFWRDQGGEPTRAGDYAGRWTKAPAALFGVDVRDLLSPKAIARLLARAPAGPAAENVGGTPAYRVKTPRADYLFATAAPHRLLRVQTAGPGDPRFDVTELTDAGPLLAEARPRVRALGGAVDPALRFAPGKPTFVNCNENVNGCTVSVPATLTAPTGRVPSGARAGLWVTITADGRALGRCRTSGEVPEGRSVTLRCTVVGQGWRTWMQRAMDEPGRHAYQASARVLGEAVAPGEVARLVTAVDRERAAADGGTARPTPSASVPTSVPTSGRP
ncbi:hypothetical protein [Actinomadura kijaniata]|uniref:hypothetical protein n=1 Tax=Actinomadura kijaniata TaxID=46161 RepID=UPI000AB739A3|nr:hypothetical protein [Actinomadura kijaniata]